MSNQPWMADKHRCIGGVDDVVTVWAVDKRANVRGEWDLILYFKDRSAFLDIFFTEGSSTPLRTVQVNVLNNFMADTGLTDDQRYRCLLLVKLFAPNLWKPRRMPNTLKDFIARMEKTHV